MDGIDRFHEPSHDWITDAYDRLWSRSEDFTAERHCLTVLICCQAPNLSASGQVVAVRDEYLQLWDFVNDAHNKKYYGGLVLTGHPSTGKYCFLLYAFARALREHIPVAYCDSPGEYYFCDGTGCKMYPTSHFVQHKTEPGKFFLALVDSNESMAIPPQTFINRSQMCFTVQATSPEPERYHHWAKERESWYWTMSLWTEDEVRKLHHFYEQEGPCPWNDSDAYYSPLEVFSLLGPSAATCFSPEGNRKTALGPAHDFHDFLKPNDVFNHPDDLLAASKRRAMTPTFPLTFDRFFFAFKPHNVPNPRPYGYGPEFHHAVPTHFLSRLLLTYFRRRTPTEQVAFLSTLRYFPQATSFVYSPAILDALCAPSSPGPAVTCHLADGSAFALGPGLVLAGRQVSASAAASAPKSESESADATRITAEPHDGHIYVLRDLSPSINAFVLSEDSDSDSDCTRVTMLQTTVAYRREVASSAVSALITLVRRSRPTTSAVEKTIKWSFVFVSPGASGEAMARKLGTVKFRGSCPATVVAGWLEVGGLLPLAGEVVDALRRDDAEHLDEKLDDNL
ncbi:hypothetical protein V8D89_004607 [Ganoderma adspersum]